MPSNTLFFYFFKTHRSPTRHPDKGWGKAWESWGKAWESWGKARG